jgi:hypothetical protein
MASIAVRFRKLVVLLLLISSAVVLLTWIGHQSLAEGIESQLVVLGSIALGILPMGGVISDDFELGTIALYAQKTGSLRQLYLRMYAGRLAGCMLISICVLALLSLTAFPLRSRPLSDVHSMANFMLAVVFLNSTIVFAFSAAGIRRDSAAAGIFFLASSALAFKIAAVDGMSGTVLRLILYPLDALFEISGSAGHRPDAPPPWVVVTAQIGLWLSVGASLVDRTVARRLLGEGT